MLGGERVADRGEVAALRPRRPRGPRRRWSATPGSRRPGSFLASQPRHCAIACGNDDDRADVGERHAGRRAQVERHRQVDLPLDQELAVEGQRVERDRHRALDHVLDRHDPAVGVAPLDRGDHLGNRPVRGPRAGREIGLREQRLLGEGPGGPEVRDARHPGIVGEQPVATDSDFEPPPRAGPGLTRDESRGSLAM